MIRVRPIKEPKRFDAECRRPGKKWLAANRTAPRPKPLWRAFVQNLAKGFDERCGYSAILIQNGEVDHFHSWKNNRAVAYEWSNYRYADGRINAKKQIADAAVLDPFEVRDDWFEIIVPSLQLRMTDRVPEQLRERAAYTLRRLGLDHDERIVTYRAQWYCMYHCGGLSLDALERRAPLIARAIRRDGLQRDPAHCGHGALAQRPSQDRAPRTAKQPPRRGKSRRSS